MLLPLRLWIRLSVALKDISDPLGFLLLSVDARTAGRPGKRAEMAIPGVHIETLRNPTLYSQEQIEQACRIAYMLRRGRLALCVVPEGWEPPEEDE